MMPTLGLDALMAFSIRFGPGPVLALLEASPSAERLYPLVIALRQELGLETKVAKEVEDVAGDSREELARLRLLGAP